MGNPPSNVDDAHAKSASSGYCGDIKLTFSTSGDAIISHTQFAALSKIFIEKSGDSSRYGIIFANKVENLVPHTFTLEGTNKQDDCVTFHLKTICNDLHVVGVESFAELPYVTFYDNGETDAEKKRKSLKEIDNRLQGIEVKAEFVVREADLQPRRRDRSAPVDSSVLT